MSRYLTTRTLAFLALLATVITVASGYLVWALERHTNEGFASLGDALWWAVVTMTTVGYGDRTPVTAGGRVVGVSLMVVGIGFLGMFTATTVSLFMSRMLREGRGVLPVKASRHIIICGWNARGPLVVDRLRRESTRPLVILADLPERPVDVQGVSFVRGRPYLC